MQPLAEQPYTVVSALTDTKDFFQSEISLLQLTDLDFLMREISLILQVKLTQICC